MAKLRFDGKVAVITGAGGGLGRCHALLLGARGAKIIVNDLGGAVDGSGNGSTTPAQNVVEEIKAAGGIAVADGNSVSTEKGAAGIIKTAMDNFGRVDILINNAGILRDKSFAKLTSDLLNSVLEVHLLGTINTSKAVWEIMKKQQYGRIINTTSAAGLFGNFGQTNYAAAKMGIVGVTKVLAIEGIKNNIMVNSLAPGAKTRMTEELLGPLADKMSPEQVSPIVAYLAHDDCPVTGEIFSAGAGRTAKIFVGATQGYFNIDVTVENIRDNFAKICDETNYAIPKNAMEEIGMVMPLLK